MIKKHDCEQEFQSIISTVEEIRSLLLGMCDKQFKVKQDQSIVKLLEEIEKTIGNLINLESNLFPKTKIKQENGHHSNHLIIQNNSVVEIENHYKQILMLINEDPQREGLIKTPYRAAKAFLELTCGYNLNLKKIVNDAIYQSDSKELVVVKGIEFHSLCEHHLLPFVGKCHVGYIPQGKVIGLSKIARVVDLYSKRLQIQENLTYQIAQCLYDVINAKGTIVRIEAEHMCMKMRGISKQNSFMITTSSVGCLETDVGIRQEFFNLTGGNK